MEDIEKKDETIVEPQNQVPEDAAYQGGYKVKLSAFEGPLDLLLHLIKVAKIEIKDIFVSQITEQYLELMQDISALDLNSASEFIEMAAYLIEIKSKALLPKITDEVASTDDPQKELIHRLEEYKLFKEATEVLQPLEAVDKFYRPPDPSLNKGNFVLGDMTMDGLVNALSKMLANLERRATVLASRKIVLDRFSVSEKIGHIKDYLMFRKTAQFTDLFEDDYTKSEIITTFQALLELLKSQIVQVIQQEVYGAIDIKLLEESEQ
ncbi:MAG: segregation/condensation protein A [Firmicutes bacterium]|nr:segregation/condensation protein A [Bacillota bacterium]